MSQSYTVHVAVTQAATIFLGLKTSNKHENTCSQKDYSCKNLINIKYLFDKGTFPNEPDKHKILGCVENYSPLVAEYEQDMQIQDEFFDEVSRNCAIIS
jgi:hypothetical protein